MSMIVLILEVVGASVVAWMAVVALGRVALIDVEPGASRVRAAMQRAPRASKWSLR